MRKVLVCQHVPFEILGILNPMLKEAGMRIRYVNFGRHPHAQPRLDGYDGLVILGGPMNVDEMDAYPHLATEIELVRQAVERDMPTLGICLGAQLIAKALGARVKPNSVKEIGWYDVSLTSEGMKDPLFRHFGGSEKIFQWHSDAFEIPDAGVHLAKSPTCAAQAFRVGRHIYGFQFHMEVDERMIERWLTLPLLQGEIESTRGEISAQTIRCETHAYVRRLHQVSGATFRRFIEFFGESNRTIVLPSR